MAYAQMPYFDASLQPTAAAVATPLVESPVVSGEEGQGGQTLVDLYQTVIPGRVLGGLSADAGLQGVSGEAEIDGIPVPVRRDVW